MHIRQSGNSGSGNAWPVESKRAVQADFHCLADRHAEQAARDLEGAVIMPRAAIWLGRIRSGHSWQSSRIRPALRSMKPVIRLRVVVLPAPFGPIRLTICPRLTSKLTSSTATNPPKRTVNPSIRSSGMPLSCAGPDFLVRAWAKGTTAAADAEVTAAFAVFPVTEPFAARLRKDSMAIPASPCGHSIVAITSTAPKIGSRSASCRRNTSSKITTSTLPITGPATVPTLPRMTMTRIMIMMLKWKISGLRKVT